MATKEFLVYRDMSAIGKYSNITLFSSLGISDYQSEGKKFLTLKVSLLASEELTNKIFTSIHT